MVAELIDRDDRREDRNASSNTRILTLSRLDCSRLRSVALQTMSAQVRQRLYGPDPFTAVLPSSADRAPMMAGVVERPDGIDGYRRSPRALAHAGQDLRVGHAGKRYDVWLRDDFPRLRACLRRFPDRLIGIAR
jgi:hypothetical protein